MLREGEKEAGNGSRELQEKKLPGGGWVSFCKWEGERTIDEGGGEASLTGLIFI